MPKSSVKKSSKAVEELTYEESMIELEAIVEKLEGETSQTALDESMKLFERGQVLVAHCNELLETAQLKVQKLAGDLVLPFEEESE